MHKKCVTSSPFTTELRVVFKISHFGPFSQGVFSSKFMLGFVGSVDSIRQTF